MAQSPAPLPEPPSPFVDAMLFGAALFVVALTGIYLLGDI